MAGWEVRTAVAGEEADIGLVAAHRTVAVAVLRTVLAVVVPHTALVGVAHHTDPVAVRRIGLEEAHHTDHAEEAAGPTAAAEVEEHRTGLEGRHTD